MNSIKLPVGAYRNAQGIWNVRDDNGHLIVNDFTETDAKQIAIAMNCHDALVVALESYAHGTKDCTSDIARSALAKVEALRKQIS